MADSVGARFLSASHPTIRELDQLVRELSAQLKTNRVHTLHADIVWRLRRGEALTFAALLELWPLGEDRVTKYARDLQLWGVITIEGTTLHLSREP
jgi:hypothetical protein